MPTYDLDEVKKAAKKEKIEYRGRNVQRDIANLEYQFEDVIACLEQLEDSDFRKTHHYQNNLTPPDDDYITTYPRPDGQGFDQLYIKLCLVDGELMIDLASFHLS